MMCAMKRRTSKKPNEHAAGARGAQPTNLYLSQTARQQGTALKKAMNRPSVSNVVETLILDKAAELGLKIPAAQAA